MSLQQPGLYARKPLEQRLATSMAVPCSFIYGKHTWMSFESAQRAAAAIEQRTGVASDCVQIRKAAHHVYLDNHREFNRTLLALLATVEGSRTAGIAVDDDS